LRATEATITFRRPFAVSALDEARPAGNCRVVTEEEEIDGLSFVAFRRTAILLHLPAPTTASATHQVVTVDPSEWIAIVEADGRNREKTQRFREISLASWSKITTFQLLVASRAPGARTFKLRQSERTP
jgi:hypothetical protein